MNSMKRAFGAFGFIVVLITQAASAQDFAAVDEQVKNYPTSFASPARLAGRIASDFSSDAEKVRAAFSWIAFNIDYDMELYDSMSRGQRIAYYYNNEKDKIVKERQFTADLALKTLRTHKAVCQGYAALFRTTCNALGIPCVDVPGTVKYAPGQIGQLPGNGDHVWNAVRIAGEWKLLDLTWAAGSVSQKEHRFVRKFNPGYFFTPPKRFALTHFPDDKNLAEPGISASYFAQLPLYYGSYFQNGCELLFPKTGIINLAGPAVLPFKIVDLPPGASVGYAMENEKYLNKVEITRKGSEAYFEVPLDAEDQGYLTVFVNNRSLVAYKIKH